jgi:hypothetical protein
MNQVNLESKNTFFFIKKFIQFLKLTFLHILNF